MIETKTLRFRVLATTISAILEVAHLGWELTHGGVVSHHILNMPEMPAISNWWGLLLLPALTWFLTGRIQQRLNLKLEDRKSFAKQAFAVLAGFLGSLVAALLLSLAFTTGNEDMASYLLFGMIAIALIVPVYRAECLLGFVLGMTFTFGVVLPTIVGSIIAAISAFMHKGVWRVVGRIWNRLKPA